MQQHGSKYFRVDTPSTTGGLGSKGHNIFFLRVVMMHIKLRGMEYRAPCKHLFCLYTHPQPWGWGQKVKTFFFLKVFMMHIKLKEID